MCLLRTCTCVAKGDNRGIKDTTRAWLSFATCTYLILLRGIKRPPNPSTSLCIASLPQTNKMDDVKKGKRQRAREEYESKIGLIQWDFDSELFRNQTEFSTTIHISTDSIRSSKYIFYASCQIVYIVQLYVSNIMVSVYKLDSNEIPAYRYVCSTILMYAGPRPLR